MLGTCKKAIKLGSEIKLRNTGMSIEIQKCISKKKYIGYILE